MAGPRIQPNFKAFAALQRESSKPSLDSSHNIAEAPGGEAGEAGETKRRKLTISEYQDPRDQLDQERHQMFAQAREIWASAAHPPEARDRGDATEE